MTHHTFTLRGAEFQARPSGALFWPKHQLLCVSDLHFGKAQRYAAQGGAALPPYETLDTLQRLDLDLAQSGAKTVICLGDSFDAVRSSRELDTNAREWILRLQAGRDWVWIEGNHDPGPMDIGGTHRSEFALDDIVFRHIASPHSTSPQLAAVPGEVSGHYHPKATLPTRLRSITRRCFIYDAARLILPAFGTYTGGMNVCRTPLDTLLGADAVCVLLGDQAQPVPRRGLMRKAAR